LNPPLHWAEHYIGLPWESGAEGPDVFDCWGLFRTVQRLYYRRDIAHIDVDALKLSEVIRAFAEHEERTRWQEVPVPEDGDAVLMAHTKYPSHVGVWLDVDAGGVLHAVQGAGVLFSSLQGLRAAGWSRVLYFRHKG
jgi:hypothetical protein